MKQLRTPSARDPKFVLRVTLGVLVAANLVAALVAFKPWGGSAADLAREMINLKREQAQRKAAIERLKTLVGKSDTARKDGELFMQAHFIPRRTASSMILQELLKAAKDSGGIKLKEQSFGYEPIEGSDTLILMIVSGGYEGTYADLVHFMNRLDRSPRFVTVESLTATPQQQAPGMLNITLKLNVFVREDGSLPPEGALADVPAAPAQAEPTQPPPKIEVKPTIKPDEVKPQTAPKEEVQPAPSPKPETVSEPDPAEQKELRRRRRDLRFLK